MEGVASGSGHSQEKPLSSGPEAYGTDVAEVIAPNRRVRVTVSVPLDEA